MTLMVTLVGGDADLSASAALVREALADKGASPGPLDWLAPDLACDLAVEPPADDTDGLGIEAAVRAVLTDTQVDFAVQHAVGRRKRLLVADMDSTIITGETLDELATLAGIGDRVVPITKRAMNGEIGFVEALYERVALLAGKPASLLDDTLAGVTLSPGAATLVQTMTAFGAMTLLISGGFHFCADNVGARCGFGAVEANQLDVADGVLTGTVSGPIVGKDRKLQALNECTHELGVDPAAALAVGDGANDLPMLHAAGLGVAYRAKPAVRAQIRIQVNYTDLTTLLYFQGYRRSEFVG